MKVAGLILLIAHVAGSTFVCAQSSHVRSLEGVTGVVVFVEQLDDPAIKSRLKRSNLQTAAELRLRTNGIQVLTKEQGLNTAERAVLVVHLQSLPLNNDRHLVIHVNVALRQYVETRNGASFGGITWQKSGMHLRDRTSAARAAKEVVEVLVDQFSNDFLSVNPKN